MQLPMSIIYRQQRAKLMYRHGVTHSQQQAHGQAVDAFTLAIENGYRPAEKARVMRGISYMALKKTEAAIADFETVIKGVMSAAADAAKFASSAVQFVLAQAHFYRGQLRHQAGQEAAALADWSRAIARSPQYAQPYYHRALVYLSQGQHQLALADFDAAIAAAPTLAQAYFHRGNLRYQLGDAPSAASDWQLAVCNDFTLDAAKHKLESVQQANYDARLSKVLAAPLAAKGLSVSVKHKGHTLEIHAHRAVGTGISYYTLPDVIREHIRPLHLTGVTHFQLIGRAGDVKRPDWNQSYDLYKGEPCPESNWQAAFSTLVLFPPFGIPAFVQAAQVKRLYKKGRYVEALSASKAVKGLCVAGSITLGFFTLLPLGYAAYSSMTASSAASPFAVAESAEQPKQPVHRPYHSMWRNN